MTKMTDLISKRLTLLANRVAILATIGLVLILMPRSFAQSSTSARLTGSVTDRSGAVLPDTHVTATNIGTNLVVTVDSDKAGNYAFNSLPVGEYELNATRDGFAPVHETG
ncbi:MAG: carboxypeptidase-like regulatory domain-containing protein, partial [Edaphobacter sp.]